MLPLGFHPDPALHLVVHGALTRQKRLMHAWERSPRLPNRNARIVAGVFVSAVSFDQLLRLRRATPATARPRPSNPSVAGSGTDAGAIDHDPAAYALDGVVNNSPEKDKSSRMPPLALKSRARNTKKPGPPSIVWAPHWRDPEPKLFVMQEAWERTSKARAPSVALQAV